MRTLIVLILLSCSAYAQNVDRIGESNIRHGQRDFQLYFEEVSKPEKPSKQKRQPRQRRQFVPNNPIMYYNYLLNGGYCGPMGCR